MNEIGNHDDDDERYVLSPHFILYNLLTEVYGYKMGEWLPKWWEHIFNDFMKSLEKSGYVIKKEG